MSKGSISLSKIVGRGLAGIRRQRGLKVDFVAEEAEISSGTLKKIEAGSQWPTATNLASILNVLNTTLGEVADFSDTPMVSHPEVVEQINALKSALDALETISDVVKIRGLERRLRQAEPQARAYSVLEKHLGHDLLERLKHTTSEDLNLLKATLPEVKEGVKKLQS